MEETIGYQALFSAEEWDELPLAEWPEDDEPGPTDDPLGPPTPSGHCVAVCFPPATYEGNEDCYELESHVCDYIGAADSMVEAKAIALLHETFVPNFAENSSVVR